jgi:hypothetical protein
MIAFGRKLFCAGLALSLCLSSSTVWCKEAIRFQELYDLLKTNLAGATEAQLNQAAVQGLLEQLRPKVNVVGEDATLVRSNSPSLVSASVFDRAYGYLRVSRMAPGLSGEFLAAYDRLASTNKLKGLIIDLRYVTGQDYAAAISVADLFFASEQPLADWGEGWKNSTAKSNALTLPVTVLINGKTSAGAEVLAGILRYGNVALLLGTNTAGQASMAKEFTLQSGHRVRVAIAPVKVVGQKELPWTGITPDIKVEVSPEDELAWFKDAYKVLARPGRLTSASTNDLEVAGTNRAPRRRMNEAELVRMGREGTGPDIDYSSSSPRIVESAAPMVTDPVLARAVDLLKGLAVVQQFRSL